VYAYTGDAVLVFHHTCCDFLITVVQWCFGRTASPSGSFSWVKLLSHSTVCRPAGSVETALSNSSVLISLARTSSIDG
jgi:hypothetical protein